jgi:hypothetical protein
MIDGKEKRRYRIALTFARIKAPEFSPARTQTPNVCCSCYNGKALLHCIVNACQTVHI